MNYATDADSAESVVSAITGKGGKAMAVQADVGSEDDVEAMFDQAKEQMGPVTALVNNAGALGEQARQHADALTRLLQMEDLGKQAPIGRLGQPDDIAATVSWLVSPQASFVTGSDVTVSGGL